MEYVYIAGIIALALVLIVWMIRDRITRGRAEFDVTKKRGAAEFEASKPGKTPPDATEQAAKPHDVDVSGNIAIGSGLIRVWQRSTRVARNWLVGKPKIEVKSPPPQKQRSSKRK
jgi:hypothetical protein